jgi:hypothetical protein
MYGFESIIDTTLSGRCLTPDNSVSPLSLWERVSEGLLIFG